jgi:PII-like signaling protein
MKLPAEAELLRIFIGESDKRHGRPLYEVIVEEARRRGMAGATVLRGTLGFGANSRIHTAKILRLSEDLPMVVEIVDTPERIAAFLPELDAMIEEGLVTLEKVRLIAYRHAGAPPGTS